MSRRVLIATHNSCTGEKGKGWRKLLTPFARCQSKTLIEQYDSGVRYFDIRVKETGRGLVAAHGLWESEELLSDLLKKLDAYANAWKHEEYYVALCYEGECKYQRQFYEDSLLKNLKLCKQVYFAEKKPKWRVLAEYERVTVRSCYKILDWRSWHTLIPIPWLWKKIYYNRVKFSDHCFRMVDFV